MLHHSIYVVFLKKTLVAYERGEPKTNSLP